MTPIERRAKRGVSSSKSHNKSRHILVRRLEYKSRKRFGPVAERRRGVTLFNLEGTRPKGMWSEIRGFSSAGRAPALQAGGHRFDPGNLHQNGPVAQLARAYD